MTQKKKWAPEGSYSDYEQQGNGRLQGVRGFQRTRNIMELYVQGRQRSSVEATKTKSNRKQVLPCEAENDPAEHRLLTERKFFGLTITDVMRLAYQISVRTRIKNKFCKKNEKA
jgi:hypothetical protein